MVPEKVFKYVTTAHGRWRKGLVASLSDKMTWKRV